MINSEAESIADEILKSGKYAGIDRSTVVRIYAEMAPKYGRRKEIVKNIKKELHIIYGLFFSNENIARAQSLIKGYGGADIYSDKEFADTLMSLHASTAERLTDATAIYDFIGGHIGADDAVVDIGCGYNPFAFPYFNTRPSGYIAYDICVRTVSLINEYFSRLGPSYSARVLDAASHALPPTPPHASPSPPPISSFASQVLLMLKIFPILERQKKGRAFEILKLSDFRVAIVSFPTRSASGRDVGMEAFYSDGFTRGLPAELSIVETAAFDNEMFYVICKNKKRTD